MTAQELPGQNALEGEEGAAFAMAVDEAAAQGGLKEMVGILAEVEPEKKDKRELDLSLCLSNISAMLMQGAYHIQQAEDTVITDNQTLSLKGGQVPEEAGKEQITGRNAAKTVGALSPQDILPKPDVPGELTAFTMAKDITPQEKATEEVARANAGNATPEPALEMAEEKNELDQADFRNIQKPQAQSAAKTAQFVGVGSAREAVKPSPGDLVENVSANRGMAAFIKPDKEKEKPVQIPAADLAIAFKAEQTLHAETAQSTRDAAQENTVREEGAAMQVARASVHALRRGMTEYRVRLSPEGLGEVEITVVTKGKAVSLSMRTDNEMARGLILDHADELRAELNQQNYQVSGFSVEVGMNGGSGTGFLASREHAEPSFDTGRMIPDQEAAGSDANREPRADSRLILPRSSTISYRI
jgi:flagellar hook-length control protein FliK